MTVWLEGNVAIRQDEAGNYKATDRQTGKVLGELSRLDLITGVPKFELMRFRSDALKAAEELDA